MKKLELANDFYETEIKNYLKENFETKSKQIIKNYAEEILKTFNNQYPTDFDKECLEEVLKGMIIEVILK